MMFNQATSVLKTLKSISLQEGVYHSPGHEMVKLVSKNHDITSKGIFDVYVKIKAHTFACDVCEE